MKVFQINRFDHNLLNDQYRVQFVINIDGTPKMVDHEAPSFDKAKYYLIACARDYILGLLDDYVNHKAKIINSGNHRDQLPALQMVQNVLMDFHQKRVSLENICQRVLKGKDFFIKILPHPNNPSYKSSDANFNEIMNFCTKALNTKILQNEC